jgi:hypothetical protein
MDEVHVAAVVTATTPMTPAGGVDSSLLESVACRCGERLGAANDFAV